jgi:hypothetical protein
VRRPPNRKTLVATVVLLVAAAVVAFARPAVGVPPVSFFKQSVEPGGL